MRAVVQRVNRAEVRVGGSVVGQIGAGLVVLVGIATDDTAATGRALAEKVLNLRIMSNEQGRMDRSLLETGGGVLCVSQFTLYGDTRKGRRPSYIRAAQPEAARLLYNTFLASMRELASGARVTVSAGVFQAMMEVELVNDGPVTILLDTDKQ